MTIVRFGSSPARRAAIPKRQSSLKEVRMRCLNLTKAVLLGVAFLSAAGIAAEPSPVPAKEAKRAIARIWKGRTLQTKADEYEAYLNRSGISKIRAKPGYLGACMLRAENGKA